MYLSNKNPDALHDFIDSMMDAGAYDALENADCLVVLTEWNEFRRPDFDRMKSLMKATVIFDGRNLYDTKRIFERGFDYTCIGKQSYSN